MFPHSIALDQPALGARCLNITYIIVSFFKLPCLFIQISRDPDFSKFGYFRYHSNQTNGPNERNKLKCINYILRSNITPCFLKLPCLVIRYCGSRFGSRFEQFGVKYCYHSNKTIGQTEKNVMRSIICILPSNFILSVMNLPCLVIKLSPKPDWVPAFAFWDISVTIVTKLLMQPKK